MIFGAFKSLIGKYGEIPPQNEHFSNLYYYKRD